MPVSEIEVDNLNPKFVYKHCPDCKLYWALNKGITRCQKCGKIMTKSIKWKEEGKVEEMKY